MPSRVVSVGDLVHNFAKALVALTPYADRAFVDWGPEPGDPWERVAEALFESLVTEPLVYGVYDLWQVSDLSLAAHDYDFNDQAHNSYIQVASAELEAFGKLKSINISDPTTIKVAVTEALGTERLLLLEACTFAFAYRRGQGWEAVETLTIDRK